MAVVFCGVDEAGRGALAGPVIAAAIVLPENILRGRPFGTGGCFVKDDIKDSKKIGPKRRLELYKDLTHCCFWAMGTATVIEIDSFNVLQATLLAMKRALTALPTSFDVAWIDGPHLPNVKKCKALIGGDALMTEIAAASILAKVHRDSLMIALSKTYPNYDFVHNKGYGTEKHLKSIKEFGITKHHRKSFRPVRDCL